MVAFSTSSSGNAKPQKPSEKASLEIDIDEILNEEGDAKSEKIEETKYKGKKVISYLKYFFLGLLVVGIVYEILVIKYLSLLSLNTPTQQDKDTISALKPYVSWLFGRSQMSPGNTYVQINSFLNSSAPYGEKKEAVEQYLSNSSRMLKKIDNQIRKIKEELGAYPYVPAEVFDKMGDTSGLKKLLLAVEAIRTYSIASLYQYLDSYIRELSINVVKEPTYEVKNKLSYFLSRWEKDIVAYLNMCYMNSYDPECVINSDFDNYLANQLLEDGIPQAKVDRYVTFFKRFIKNLLTKIEVEPKPVISLVLNNLDPEKNTVSFKMEINIPQEVYVQLLKKLPSQEPNLFVVSQMMNLLRGSHFIVGDNLGVDSIKVTLRKEKIGNIFRNYYVSNYTFTVPIQKEAQVEIYDFKY